jgi:hypothetical protein
VGTGALEAGLVISGRGSVQVFRCGEVAIDRLITPVERPPSLVGEAPDLPKGFLKAPVGF